MGPITLGALSGSDLILHSVVIEDPEPGIDHAVLHRFQPKPRRLRARIKWRRTFFSTHSFTNPKHRAAFPTRK
jgi:hypothetical protein